MKANYIHSLWINQNSAIMENWRYLMVNTKDVFRTQSNIFDGAFFAKAINGF